MPQSQATSSSQPAFRIAGMVVSLVVLVGLLLIIPPWLMGKDLLGTVQELFWTLAEQVYGALFYFCFVLTITWYLVTLWRLNTAIQQGDFELARYRKKLNDLAASASVVFGLTGTATNIFNGFSFVLGAGQHFESPRLAIQMMFTNGIGEALGTTVGGLLLALAMDTLQLLLVGRSFERLREARG